MNSHELIRHIEPAELRGLVEQLERGRRDYEARLAEVEARKDALFADGSARSDRRGQEARARQIAALEEEANQLAGLLRIAHKQRLLLDRLIWLRENLALIERWREEFPAAVPFDWRELVQATALQSDDEARLDQINDALEKAEGRWQEADGRAPTADGATQAGDEQTTPARQVSPARPPEQPTSPRRSDPASADPSSGLLVVRVLDGATIELANGWRVRYIGLDAPLMRNALGKADAGAWEARDANRALVGHKRVRLEADQLDADADGALWRYVYVGDVMVNAELLRQGMAYYVSRYPNNRHAEALLAAEQDARRHRRGLWKTHT
ncbi:MAG: thermonuclease family protein [Anaerolineae bacterium]|nr:thermonuclease family protein [Anaerolineae bacterium]